jgi:predicted transposase YbfD/YdcC
MAGLSSLFEGVENRRAPNVSHKLCDLLVIMVAATLCGQVTATDMALFAAHRKDVLNRIVAFDHAPSHDTISRVLRLVEPKAFGEVFAVFMTGFAKAVATHGGADIVALDGKSLRRAYESGRAHAPPLMVSAFDCRLRLCIAMGEPAPGKGEVDAALRLVELLDLTGKIITADALHCTHEMTRALTAGKADYVIGLKKNRPAWFAEAKALFAVADAKGGLACASLNEPDHHYTANVIAAPAALCAGHAAFGRVVSCHRGKAPVTRLFMMSRRFEPGQLIDIARSHWAIENNLHWILDVHLGEDLIRARKDHAPANIALVKRIARNILQTLDLAKTPISHRTRKCMWNDDYLINALTYMR